MPAAGAGRWGLHRLDRRWADRLVAAARVQPGDFVLDIGAGTGAITERLVAARAVVLAVELHPGRAAELRARFEGQPVKVVRADAADLRLPARPFKVVANPPFSVGAAVVRRITAPGRRLEAAAHVVPTWMACRWAASGRPGFDVAVGPPVPADAFRPPPPNPTSLLLIAPSNRSGRRSTTRRRR